jgi:predicted metal-dependent phosphoesterase TrpH
MGHLWRVRTAVLAATFLAAAYGQSAEPGKRWYKGNLHTHTLNSDGDSTPHEVTTWYREHGYNFLVLTDHNHLTDIKGLNAIHAAKDKFLLITGEEVSDSYQKKPIHINAYNPERLVEPQHGDSVASTIQNNVNEIRSAKGLPSVNHPNFHWAITVEDLLAVKGLGLFEVYNGHPMVNNDGGGGYRSLDEMWDALLTAGQRLYGIAVDDAHVFKRFGKDYSNPGHGWIQVRAQELTPDAILGSIEAGDFYASTGVTIRDIQISDGEYRIEVEPADRWEEKLTTLFIGDGGKVLAKSFDRVATYKFSGTEKYIRARVESSGGAKAWTQPVFRTASTAEK